MALSSVCRHKNRSASAPRALEESGQAIVEYILLLAVILSVFLVVARGLGKIGLVRRLMDPLNKEFASVYRYGHPRGEAYPANTHPRKRVYVEVKP